MIVAARPQIADQRRALEHCRDIIERETDAGLVRDAPECAMPRWSSRRSPRRSRRHFPGSARVTRSRGSGPPSCRSRITSAPALRATAARSSIDGRDHRRAERRKPEHLRHHAHGVGGELARAGAEGRHRRALERIELLGATSRRSSPRRRLRRWSAPTPACRAGAGQRRAAEDEDRRHVAADHRHHDARAGSCRSRRSRSGRHRHVRASRARSNSAITSRDTSEHFMP